MEEQRALIFGSRPDMMADSQFALAAAEHECRSIHQKESACPMYVEQEIGSRSTVLHGACQECFLRTQPWVQARNLAIQQPPKAA
ncbi:hypothetical protein HYZ99_05145 [Candidatus Peregrinibacteria bacterium]|nr:hypothetical protein [Candidatus Peregrinibacteria bacterium]